MKVGEHSKVTAKYLDPERYLLNLFPSFQECRECHTIIELESARDVYHATFHHESAPIRRDWLEWECAVCQRRNQFTFEEVLVNAHRRLIRSKHDQREQVVYAALSVFAFIFLVVWALSW